MQKSNRLLYLLAFIKFILPFVLQDASYQLHRDEFLYLAEGSHVAWGFMEIPPLLSVFAWVTNALGAGMFWVKFWPSLFGAFTYIIVGRIILLLGGRSFALLLGFLPFVFGVYLRVHYLFQPNFLEIFFWTMIAYSLIQFTYSKNNYWLYIFGLNAGLGMLSKYSVAFYIIAILTGLLLTKHRSIFTNRHFYFSVLIALFVFLPNAIWQYTHHFPVIHHMKLLQQTQLQYVSPVTFLIDQFLMHLPCVFIWLAGVWFTAFAVGGKSYRFIAWAYAAVIILLIALHGKNYYTLGVYPVLFAFGAYHLEQYTLHRFKVIRYALIVMALVLGIVFIPVGLPVASPQKLEQYYKTTGIDKSGALKWEDLKDHPLPQDFADMLGWEEIAQKTAAAYNSLSNEEKEKTFLFADNYGQAGAINYYAAKYHLPQCYSSNASFLYWLPHPVHITNLLLITDDEDEMQHPFIKDFASAQLTGSVDNIYARERGSLIILLKGANESFNKMFQQKIEEDKAEVNGMK